MLYIYKILNSTSNTLLEAEGYIMEVNTFVTFHSNVYNTKSKEQIKKLQLFWVIHLLLKYISIPELIMTFTNNMWINHSYLYLFCHISSTSMDFPLNANYDVINIMLDQGR